MDTRTGRIYDAPAFEEGARLMRREQMRMQAADDERELKAALMEEAGASEEHADAAVGIYNGRVVAVSEEVVQKVRLGERELERRQRRRKASRQARKHNRR